MNLRALPALVLLVFAVSVIMIVCDRYMAGDDNLVTKLPALHGKSIDTVITELGQPDHEFKFRVDEIGSELRGEILNTYPREHNADVEIRELRWQDGDYTLAVWFHLVDGKWIVLDTCRWHKSIVF